MPHTEPIDVVIVGGGPAGLQAALTVGRMHLSALLVDSGSYRNAPAGHMHNFVTHDGRPPAEFRALARADLAAYESVTVRQTAVTHVRRLGAHRFETVLADGSVLASTAVVLATGVRDILPDIPGVAELFGRLVHHCPFCHGHELSGGVVGVQGGPRAAHLVPMLSRIADEVVVVQHDWEPSDEERAALGVGLVPGRVHKAVADGERLVLEIDEGSITLDGLFAATTFEQAAPFAEQLGLDVLDSGCVEIDLMGRTSVPGVYAAGDLAHTRELAMPASSVLAAAGAGQMAGATCVAESASH